MRNDAKTVAVFSGGGTGGHLYPALALLEGLKGVRTDLRPFFVGAEKGLEARVLPQRGLENLLLPVRGLQRGAFWGNLKVLLDLARSVLLTADAFNRLRPGVVVVTGGYAAGPAGIAAGLMGVPLALQEQNAHPGITTRFLSRWAAQVHLAFPEAQDRLHPRSRSRIRISGNPIGPPSPESPGEARAAFGLDPRGRVILVTGGSQGSSALNEAVLAMVRDVAQGVKTLPSDLQLLWVTGPAHLEKVTREVRSLGRQPWIQLRGYTQEMARAMRSATVAVSRSGAMTTSELLAHGVPSILVPLPTSAEGHQTRNALSLAAAGASIHISQDELTGAQLWTVLDGILRNEARLEAMAQAALERGRPEATREISMALAELLPLSREVRS